jgi:hypothetical protein
MASGFRQLSFGVFGQVCTPDIITKSGGAKKSIRLTDFMDFLLTLVPRNEILARTRFHFVNSVCE